MRSFMMLHIAASPRRAWVAICLVVPLVLPGCGTSAGGEGARPSAAALRPADPAIRLPDGFRAEIYAVGLRSPTAMAWGPDGNLYLTQLNGGENVGTVQVVMIEGPGASPTAMLDNIRKPTGLAWRDDELYVVAARDVVRSRLSDGAFESPDTIVREMPFGTARRRFSAS